MYVFSQERQPNKFSYNWEAGRLKKNMVGECHPYVNNQVILIFHKKIVPASST